MDGDSSTRTFGSRVAGFMPFVATGLIVVLLLGTAGFFVWRVFGGEQESSADETLRFIALLITVMVALGATAALFVLLRMGNRDEPFGLPSGSIRALLALGIMMLLVAFGMPVITTNGDPIAPIDAQVAPARLDEAVRNYRQEGFIVVVTSPGIAPTTATVQGQPGSPGTNATIRIFGRLPTQSAAQLDLTKQLLTAIITLLTTVIGFYFGSRSSTDAIREAGGTPGPAPSAADLRRQAGDTFTPLQTRIGEIARKIAAIKQLGEGATEAQRNALPEAERLQREIETKRDSVAHELTAADTALAALATAATAEERGRKEAAAREALRKAAEATAALREMMAAYETATSAF